MLAVRLTEAASTKGIHILMHPPWTVLHLVVVFLRAVVRAALLFFNGCSATWVLRGLCSQQTELHIDRGGSAKISSQWPVIPFAYHSTPARSAWTSVQFGIEVSLLHPLQQFPASPVSLRSCSFTQWCHSGTWALPSASHWNLLHQPLKGLMMFVGNHSELP